MSWVLIVEDSLDLAEALRRAIQFEGQRAEVVHDGVQALKLLRASKNLPRLILLDLMMPIMNGWEFLTERDKVEDFRHIPVVICSASPQNIPSGLRVLRKPLDLDAIVDLLAEHLPAVAE